MAESNVILAYLDGLGPGAAPQAIGNLRGDLKAFAEGDFKTTLSTLCMYDGDLDSEEAWGRRVGNRIASVTLLLQSYSLFRFLMSEFITKNLRVI